MAKPSRSRTSSKEVAIGKRAKISEAQKYTLISVFCASIFLGVGISLTMRFINQITFNAKVISAEEESIANYSNVIKNAGICTKPKGSVYTNDELKKCDPDNIEISQIPDTLRYNILEKLAANKALSSVPKEGNSNCLNPETSKNYTYEELNNAYASATTTEARQLATQRIKTCSALRIIPDALPAFKNEEALLASLNRILNISGWSPETLSPSGESTASDIGENLNAIEVALSIEADSGTTMNVLRNIERSIREFNVDRATIEWSSNNTLTLQTRATAYYMDESTVTETTKTLKPGGNNKR